MSTKYYILDEYQGILSWRVLSITFLIISTKEYFLEENVKKEKKEVFWFLEKQNNKKAQWPCWSMVISILTHKKWLLSIKID